jgi:hypothetical protein
MTIGAPVEWKITPHLGVGPILLGAARKDLREQMDRLGFGLNRADPSYDHFSESCAAVEFDDEDHVKHIGLFHDARIIPTYFGKDVFGMSARKSFALMAEHDGTGPHEFVRTGYLFPGQILSVFDASSQYNYRCGGRDAVWMQIGLGNADYLKIIQDLMALI